MAVIECEIKGTAVYCPRCGRANPDVCLLTEMKDNGGPPLDEPVEAAGEIDTPLAMCIPDGIPTSTSEAPVGKNKGGRPRKVVT